MKKTFSVVAAASLLAACSGSELDPGAVRGALPPASTVQLGTPAADSSGATALRAQALAEPGAIAVNAESLVQTPA